MSGGAVGGDTALPLPVGPFAILAGWCWWAVREAPTPVVPWVVVLVLLALVALLAVLAVLAMRAVLARVVISFARLPLSIQKGTHEAVQCEAYRGGGQEP